MTAGIIIIGVVVGVALWLLCRQQIAAGGFFGVTLAGVLAGAVVAGLPRIIAVTMKAGTTTSVAVKWQEVEKAVQQVSTQAQQVQTDAIEVRQMKEQIQEIVGRLEKSEQTVSQMDSAVQETNKGLKNIQEQQIPRRLSDEQRRTLVGALSSLQRLKVEILSVVGDSEGLGFSRNFRDVFKEAGWGDVQMNVIIPTKDIVGIEIHVNEAEAKVRQVPPSVNALAKTLMQMGLVHKSQLFADPKTPVGKVVLTVGRKP